MAYATKYTIPFCSLQGIQYEVQVKVDGFTGTAVALTGSEHPFYTAEKNDKEWLQVPIRTQSGYIRIVCGESIWRDLIPTTATSHYVELIRIEDASVQWRGFIKPETFTHSLYSGVDEYEFPVQCPLSVLAGKYLEWNDATAITSFAALTCRLLDLCGVTFGDVYFPDNVSDRYADLLAVVNVAQFYKVEQRNVVTPSFKVISEDYMANDATALEMLQAVCKFWGWELRTRGTDIWFTAYDEHTAYRKLSYADLASMTSATQFAYVRPSSPDLLTAEYMTDRHEVELGLPAQTIEVNTNVSATEDLVKVDIDKIGQFSGLPESTTLSGGKYTAEYTPFRREYLGVIASGLTIWYQGNAYDDNSFVTTYLVPRGAEQYYHPPFRKYDSWNSSDDASKTRYNPTTCIFMSQCPNNATSEEKTASLSFTSLNAFSFQNCALCIHAQVKSNNSFRASISYLSMALRIGKWEWNGSSWDEWSGSEWRPTWFNVPIGSNTSSSTATNDGVIVNNFNYQTPYQGAEGYTIPVSSSISGDVILILKWQQLDWSTFELALEQGTPSWMELHDFGMDVVQSMSTTTINGNLTDSHTYKHENENESAEDISIDLEYCTFNENKYGVAFVESRDGGYMTTLTWENDTTERPEEHLLNRLSALHDTPTEWREIDIKDSALWVGCDRLLQDENGTLMAPIAVARDWVDGIARLTLGKLPAWTPPSTYNLADCYSNPLADTNDNLLTAPGE